MGYSDATDGAGATTSSAWSRRRFLTGLGLSGAGLAAAALLGCGTSDDDEATAAATPISSGAASTPAATTVASSATPAAGSTLPTEFVFANDA